MRIGCIDVGNRRVQLLRAFHAHAQIVALTDVYDPYLNNKYDQIDPRFKTLGKVVPSSQPDFGNPVDRYKDFRKILDSDDVDAVIVATPDHWHAIRTIMACQASKDVYVEKPLSMTIRKGRRIVEAARKANRVVQVGTQRRSSRLYAELRELVHLGALGKVTVARWYHCRSRCVPALFLAIHAGLLIIIAQLPYRAPSRLSSSLTHLCRCTVASSRLPRLLWLPDDHLRLQLCDRLGDLLPSDGLPRFVGRLCVTFQAHR